MIFLMISLKTEELNNRDFYICDVIQRLHLGIMVCRSRNLWRTRINSWRAENVQELFQRLRFVWVLNFHNVFIMIQKDNKLLLSHLLNGPLNHSYISFPYNHICNSFFDYPFTYSFDNPFNDILLTHRLNLHLDLS
jgi:hypothetical protein